MVSTGLGYCKAPCVSGRHRTASELWNGNDVFRLLLARKSPETAVLLETDP